MNSEKEHIVLLDGGMGQELRKRSSRPVSPLLSAQVMLEEPHLVTAAHRDFIEAGAQVIKLNNYSATPIRLARDGNSAMFEPLHAAALSAAHLARKESGQMVLIAGCLPPLVASYHSDSVPDNATCQRDYRRLVERQAAAAREMTELGAERIMVNCSVPEAVTAAMSELAKLNVPFGGYANGFTSVAPLQPGGTVDKLASRTDLDPAAYTEHALGWIEQGSTVVGGCCEVGPLLNEQPRQIKVASLLNEGGLAQIPTDLQGFGVRFGVAKFSNMVATKGTVTS